MKTILLFVGALMGSLSFAQTYNFTNAGVTGRFGPTQAEVNTAYTSTTLDGDVIINTQGIQEWVVPFGGVYTIDAVGASGGNSTWSGSVSGGNGYSLSGDFILNAGDTIKIVVGHQGESAAVGGGGGATYVVFNNSPLIVAGAGGGASSDQPGVAAVILNDGTAEGNGLILGGTAGNGGSACTGGENNGGAGSGFLTDGQNAQPVSGVNWGRGGLSFLNGSIGGEPGRQDGACAGDPFGGFGGGGSGTCNTVGGGGGAGYSGGAGGLHLNNCGTSIRTGGGGGGSFNSGTNSVDNGATNVGDGLVNITLVCTPTTATPDVVNLPAVISLCSASPAAPTALTDCGSTIQGTPDVTFPISTLDTTLVTWTYNVSGTVVTQTQQVIIVDTIAPIADAVSLIDTSAVCQIDSLVAPTATDSCVGQIVGTPDVTFPITTQGLTVITWTYDDGQGNVSTQVQNVTLNDTIAPVPDSTSLPDLTVCIEANPAAPTAMDNCLGVISATPDVTLPITTAGLTTITWTFEDANNNQATLTQNVTVSTVDIGITQASGTLTASQAGAVYQWLDCDNNYSVIAGETTQTHSPTALAGNYACEVTINGCTDTTACELVDFTSLNEINSFTLSISPNPSQNGLFQVNTSSQLVSIDMYDMLGRSVNVQVNVEMGTVEANTLSAGTYQMVVTTEFGTKVSSVIINK